LHRPCGASAAIDEQSFGPDHPNVAAGLSNLAALLNSTNRLAEAEPLMRRALAIREKSYGPDHLDVANSLNGTGNAEQGRRMNAFFGLSFPAAAGRPGIQGTWQGLSSLDSRSVPPGSQSGGHPE